MKDKEKQIEEMAKIIRPVLTNRTHIAFIPALDKPIAQELYEQGYRKINENEVVISKADYDNLKHFEKRVRSGVCLTQKEWFDFCNEDSNRRTCLRIEERERERKETAKKILTSIGNMYDECDSRFKLKDYQWHKDLCKQYGVEIGE